MEELDRLPSNSTCGTRINGNGLHASGGECSSSVGNHPNEGRSRLGGGQAAGGQPEPGQTQASTGGPGDERRSTALSNVNAIEHPGIHTRNAVAYHLNEETTTDEGASPPTQSANTEQSAGTPQSEGSVPTQDGGSELEERPQAPTSTQSQRQADSVNAPRQQIPNGRKSRRGNLGIGTLNIKGGGSLSSRGKWLHLWQIMREQGIDVLTVQEAHLDNARKDTVQQTCDEYVHIMHSWNGVDPNSDGIAFVLNKRTTRWKEAKMTELIPGRAAYLHMPWHGENETKILGVYAPNSPNENANFWSTLETEWHNGLYTKPDIILGDTNFVEDSLDRMPGRNPPPAPAEALGKLKTHFGLVDGWRQTNPSTRKFTFRTERGDSQSRLDRIYIKEDLMRYTHQWEIARTGLSTDHKLVSVRLLNPTAPYLGKGRYSISNALLQHKKLFNQILELGEKFQSRMTELQNIPRDHENNPQREHKKFKEQVVNAVRTYAKTAMPKIRKNIENLEKNMQDLLNDTSISDEDKRTSTALIDERIAQLEKIRHNRARDNLATKCRLENETNSKFWYQLNKPKKARDTIAALTKPSTNPPELARKSSDMAHIAKCYHESLQKEGIPEGVDEETETKNVLQHLNQSLNEQDRNKLAQSISEQDVREAIRDLPKGKSPGLDGLTHELWSTLLDRHDSNPPGHENETFDVVANLTKVFNDIEKYGVEEGTDFSKGWMCPLYKKNERTDISNYRPITILNSDYKIFTRALTSKLSAVVPDLIHRDQAGFMKGRKIEDQTELIKMIISRCEAQDENGAIVCLDQEKAYDKINHNFLWESMKKFGLPDEFITTVQNLYKDAKTVVILNGVISDAYKVIRGVRQGDPLSCLLFNLAIESLAQMLRDSDLEGFRIKDERERLIATLFADDTTVYMSENDEFSELQKILDKWCQVSGAKFNVPKTTVIPVGSKEYREQVITNRRLHRNTAIIPRGIHIAEEGEPTRVLGAFVGNNVDELNVWAPAMEKITRDLEMWNKGHPTLKGRTLISKSIIGGYTQYLTRVQGMPKSIESRLGKMSRDYMWDGAKSSPVNQATLNRAMKEGGRNCLNVAARNEAIELMKLKSYLNLNEDRPRWAKVADELMGKNISSRRCVRDETSIVNSFLQDYDVKTRVNTTLPHSLIMMLKTADKYKVCLAPIALSNELQGKMPIWYHIGTDKNKKMINNDAWARCHRSTHRITTVKEMEVFVNERPGPGERAHKERVNCICICCRNARTLGCMNPDKCRKAGRKTLNTLGHKWDPRIEQDNPTTDEEQDDGAAIDDGNNAPVTFNPDYLTHGSLRNAIRVFVNKETQSDAPAVRNPGDIADHEELHIYTDGSCQANGGSNARAGSGIWYGVNDDRNRAIRIPLDIEQSNNTGEAIAILVAVQTAPPNVTIHIHSDSKIVIDGLTKNLVAWENKGWIGIANSNILKAIVARLRARKGKCKFTKVKGHSGDPGNDGADTLANQGAEKDIEQADAIDLTIPEGFDLSGAKLAEMTQALLYKGIMELTTVADRRNTTILLDMVRHTINDNIGDSPSDARIWKSLQDKDISNNISAFMWRTMHDSYRVGEKWSHIPNYEHRAKCQTCNATETMEHILTECPDSGQSTIWLLAQNLWAKKGLPWYEPTVGAQLGCALAVHKNAEGKRLTGATRLYKILMTESTHLIWKIRCEWRIGREADPEKKHTTVEIENRWYEAINRRLKFDCLMTDNVRYGRKAIRSSLVKQTWEGTLNDEPNLPEKWYRTTGVLVGRGAVRPRGRNR
ncbi:hypothetical protein D9615_009166 [Tricholomella constricta]|uniref:Reverse transcriptase domain-containing protein n=1 Tax=Tricholomella constricta TaxID=117010 RepID=A0A8H5H2F6_9AGAR|nr:hypothetical protein D9615_009166 [Tricholomella constricta]